MDPMLIFKIKYFHFLFLLSLFLLCCFLSLILFVQDGETPLHIVASRGSKGIVKILVEYGSNVDLQDNVFSLSFIIIIIWFLFV